MKIKLRPKHWEIGQHYARFIDRRWHPDFTLTAESLEIFIRVESYGRGSCTEEELALAAPLFNGKIQRELTLKLLFDEMADWWSGGNGWFYPIAHTFQTEWSREQRDKVFIRALVKIMREIRRNGFVRAMVGFTGMSDEDKDRYLQKRIAPTVA